METNLRMVFLAQPTSIAELVVAMEKAQTAVMLLLSVVVMNHSVDPVRAVLSPMIAFAAATNISITGHKGGNSVNALPPGVTKHLLMLQVDIDLNLLDEKANKDTYLFVNPFVAGKTLLLELPIMLEILAQNRRIRQVGVIQTQKITSDSLSTDALSSGTPKYPIVDPLSKMTLLSTVPLVLLAEDLTVLQLVVEVVKASAAQRMMVRRLLQPPQNIV